MSYLNINAILKWPDHYKEYLMKPTTPRRLLQENTLANIYLEGGVKYCIPVHILLGVSPLIR